MNSESEQMEMEQMKWNSDQQAYFGKTSDGKAIRVEGDEMAEAAQDAGVDVGELSGVSVFQKWENLTESEQMLLNADMWAEMVGANDNVEYV